MPNVRFNFFCIAFLLFCLLYHVLSCFVLHLAFYLHFTFISCSCFKGMYLWRKCLQDDKGVGGAGEPKTIGCKHPFFKKKIKKRKK